VGADALGPIAHDRARIERALALAAKGRFRVEPNPTVGCVLDVGGQVVGEGWHDGYGGPHAEVRALVAAGERARGATCYVSLAPCGRHGKTPPCADTLVAAGVARVVYAACDPSPREGGAGLATLARAGIAVEGPLAPMHGDALLERFRRSLASPRPWTILKWAMSADGRAAPRVGAGGRLTGARAESQVHELRGRCDAVLVGKGTLLADDPLLTCRLEGGVPDGRPQPLRAVVARGLGGLGGRLLASAAQGPVLVAVASAEPALRARLAAGGVEVLEVGEGPGGVHLPRLLERLRARGVARLLVEGGARLHGALLAQGLADQVQAWVAPLVLGGGQAVPAVLGSGVDDVAHAPHLTETQWRRVGEDLVLDGYVEPVAPPSGRQS
jgi:diaminohydroxyphosphoribosylaminopyrimidine deaminase / 5-amino-6-(5-phosphoribosylamino)uracil reductase